MKTYSQLLMLIFLFTSRSVLADLIPGNAHYVSKCVKITNLKDYPEISMIGFERTPSGQNNQVFSISSSCIALMYKYDKLTIYALKKTYLEDKDISVLDLPHDKNAVKTSIPIYPYFGYVSNSNPLVSMEEYYKIVGFTDTSVVIYKWQEISKFNNGQKDQFKTFDYTGDISILSQKILTGTSTSESNSGIELFPNPAQKNVHLKISNNYQGIVHIGVFTTDGKKINSMFATKESATLDYIVPISSLPKGTYLVYVGIGKKSGMEKNGSQLKWLTNSSF